MPLPYFEVDVPIHRTGQPGLNGVHIFTGRADSRSAAVRIAHEVYDAARAAAAAGREIPHGRPDGWGACGYRPGWELDWPAATADRWNNPSWTRTDDGDFEM
ncbi:hypothetical protein K7472_30210 [Streptomyces sp. PTM05]|uniref:Uncharacterized protein n=1 Tax=Streptantibioticus parmotrematis TaxID=2873249 RepID=A0ABS7R0U9_9ACTN|nr:hypothetical protein [Streptantibioticus parmotrematis]MBY8889087.1 hypothetical protein [Streptantibioticus parmotrematis]